MRAYDKRVEQYERERPAWDPMDQPLNSTTTRPVWDPMEQPIDSTTSTQARPLTHREKMDGVLRAMEQLMRNSENAGRTSEQGLAQENNAAETKK
ncbi:hypothetical protein FRC03_012341 [Tulasnella sp. 419]|nr:hypothetical protein FRC03_012341 [Tulasnella sp. 419]